MDLANVTIGLAFLAGLASFFSPCVFSLVPAYVGYLGGRAAGGEIESPNRWLTFTHAVAFVAGFSLVFIIFFGLPAAFLGGLLRSLSVWISRIGGLIVVVFGLHMIGILRIPFLEYDVRLHNLPDPKLGYLSSLLMGVFFSAGWSPCIGPTLSLILALSITGQTMLLLAAYSAGMAIPFLIAALGIGWVTTILRRYSKAMRYVEIGMGVIMIIVGILLLTGRLAMLSNLGTFVDFGL